MLRPAAAGVLGAKTITVELEETPGTAIEAKSARDDTLELGVREVTFMDRVRYQWDAGQGGVIVTESVTGGWAYMAGLRINDLVLAIDGQEIADLAAFEQALKALGEARPQRFPVFLRRGYRTHYVFVEPDWDRGAGVR